MNNAAHNSTTYNSTNHKYLRIRESGGTVYADTSPNGVDWTQFASVVPTTSPVFPVAVRLNAYSGTSGTVLFDNVNYVVTGNNFSWSGQAVL